MVFRIYPPTQAVDYVCGLRSSPLLPPLTHFFSNRSMRVRPYIRIRMTRNSRRSGVDGFTLFEVMMASAVMILALVGMIQVIVSGTEMLDVSRKQTIAMQIIHSQIDNVRLSSWSTVIGYTSPITVNVDDSNQSTNNSYGFQFGSTFPTICKGFQCTRTISTVRTDLKMITFTVTWQSNTGRSYTRTGSTYFGNNGLYVTYQRS